MVLRSTCSLRSQAGTRLNSRIQRQAGSEAGEHADQHAAGEELLPDRHPLCVALEAIHRRAARRFGITCTSLSAVITWRSRICTRWSCAEDLEVMQRAQVHVRRVIPLVGQFVRNRHIAAQHLQAVLPVAEIGEADDAFAPDAQHLLHQRFGVACGLQRLRQDDEIEGAALETGQCRIPDRSGSRSHCCRCRPRCSHR